MSGIISLNSLLESNVWNQVSKLIFGIKCLESGVQIGFGNQVSWNHMSGIKGPELILESGVRESNI